MSERHNHSNVFFQFRNSQNGQSNRRRLTKLEEFNVKNSKEIEHIKKIVSDVNIQLPTELLEKGNDWLPSTQVVFQNWAISLQRGNYQKKLTDITNLYNTSKKLVSYKLPVASGPLLNYYNALRWITTGRLFWALNLYLKNHVKTPRGNYDFCFSELRQTVSEYNQLWGQTSNNWYRFSNSDRMIKYYLTLKSTETIMQVINEYGDDAYKIFQGGVTEDLNIKNIIKTENQKDRNREQNIQKDKQHNDAAYDKKQEYYRKIVGQISSILQDKDLLLPDNLKNSYAPPLDESSFLSWYDNIPIKEDATSAKDVFSIYKKNIELLKMPYRKADIYGQVNNYYNAIVYVTSTSFLYQLRDITNRYGILTNDKGIGMGYENYSYYQLKTFDQTLLRNLIENHTEAMNSQEKKYFSDRDWLDDINEYMTGKYILDKIKFIRSNMGNIDKVIASK